MAYRGVAQGLAPQGVTRTLSGISGVASKRSPGKRRTVGWVSFTNPANRDLECWVDSANPAYFSLTSALQGLGCGGARVTNSAAHLAIG